MSSTHKSRGFLDVLSLKLWDSWFHQSFQGSDCPRWSLAGLLGLLGGVIPFLKARLTVVIKTGSYPSWGDTTQQPVRNVQWSSMYPHCISLSESYLPCTNQCLAVHIYVCLLLYHYIHVGCSFFRESFPPSRYMSIWLRTSRFTFMVSNAAPKQATKPYGTKQNNCWRD